MARLRREEKIESLADSRKRMKKFDLDSELKALRVPERGRDFWEAFPRSVAAELRAAPRFTPARTTFRPRLVWGLAAGVACLAAALCLGHETPKTLYCVLLKDEKELRQTVRQFPAHVRALMQDEHGLHKLIEDQP